MTEADYGTFERAFGRVCGAFSRKLSQGDKAELTQSYFKVLATYDLEAVLLAGRELMETSRKFPLVAEWLAVLRRGAALPTATDARYLGVTELAEYARAEHLRYTDTPCGCAECQEAGVADVPQRFVPTLIGGTEERAFHPQRKALVVCGHWAHGEELRRWHEARASFVAAVARIPPRLRRVVRRVVSCEDAVDAILHPRERDPGEEG